jgi:outer membrane immunogenic protein
MKSKTAATFLSAMLASSAILGASQVAFANGQGTPMEPAPAPAPTVMEPMGPAPAVEMPAAAPMWGGFYIGGYAGYGFQPNGDDEALTFDTNLDGEFNDTVRTGAGADAFAPGFCGGASNSNSASEGCRNDDNGGFDGGIRFGYDIQSGSFVYGGLLEASYVDIEDNVTGFSSTPAAYTFKRELDFLGAARLKAGFILADDYLLYATGGVAYGNLTHKFATSNTANSFAAVDEDGSWGYQLGGGVETMIGGGMSLGIEYMYTSLNDENYTVNVGPGSAPATNPFLLVNAAGTDIRRGDDNFELHSVRGTLSYRFGM